jgi:hypothetical protein
MHGACIKMLLNISFPLLLFLLILLLALLPFLYLLLLLYYSNLKMEAEVSFETFYLSFYLTAQDDTANFGNIHVLLTLFILIYDGLFNTLAAILYTQDAEKLRAHKS